VDGRNWKIDIGSIAASSSLFFQLGISMVASICTNRVMVVFSVGPSIAREREEEVMEGMGHCNDRLDR